MLIIPLSKKYKIFILELVKIYIPNIKKSIKFACFLIDLMMFGMQFLINFEAFIYLIFLKGTTYKKRLFWIHFESIKIETFCWQYLRRKCTKYSFENWSKTAYQTSKIDQIFMFFDRFDDVWYAVFDQFRNEYFVLFSQGYYQQNYLIFIDSKWIQKRLFLYVIPLGKI